MFFFSPPPATRSDGGGVGGTRRPPTNSDPTIWEAIVLPPPPPCSSDLAATLPLPTLLPPPPPPPPPPQYFSLCLRTAQRKSSPTSGLDVPFPQMATLMSKRIPDVGAVASSSPLTTSVQMTIMPSILHPKNDLALPAAVVDVVVIVPLPSSQSAVHMNVSIVSAIQGKDPPPASSSSSFILLSSSSPSSSANVFPSAVAVAAVIIAFPLQDRDGRTCTPAVPRGPPPRSASRPAPPPPLPSLSLLPQLARCSCKWRCSTMCPHACRQ